MLSFRLLNWFSLIFIYFVVITGSIVRTTGSGMGCPDWPKCFGSWIPPTDQKQLPENYKELFGAKRTKKVEKFCKMLSSIGMKETATRIKKDPSTYKELPFNAQKTWVEYLNRLAGFIAGNLVLLIFLITLFRKKYRSNRLLLFLTFANLLILTIEAWFGSIVVATNLVPWTISIHLFLALVIILIQLKIISLLSTRVSVKISKKWRSLLIVILVITFIQMFLGTQVRQYVDELSKQGFGRSSWSGKFGWPYFIHRSFSWIVLVLISFLAWKNYLGSKWKNINYLFLVLVIELTSGVLLAYAGMPGYVQVSHLLFATVLLGISYWGILRTRKINTTV